MGKKRPKEAPGIGEWTIWSHVENTGDFLYLNFVFVVSVCEEGIITGQKAGGTRQRQRKNSIKFKDLSWF